MGNIIVLWRNIDAWKLWDLKSQKIIFFHWKSECEKMQVSKSAHGPVLVWIKIHEKNQKAKKVQESSAMLKKLYCNYALSQVRFIRHLYTFKRELFNYGFRNHSHLKKKYLGHLRKWSEFRIHRHTFRLLLDTNFIFKKLRLFPLWIS